MKPSHKNPAPAAVVAAVVSAVVAAVAIAADAVASNKAPTSGSYGRGASVEAPLLKLQLVGALLEAPAPAAIATAATTAKTTAATAAASAGLLWLGFIDSQGTSVHL